MDQGSGGQGGHEAVVHDAAVGSAWDPMTVDDEVVAVELLRSLKPRRSGGLNYRFSNCDNRLKTSPMFVRNQPRLRKKKTRERGTQGRPARVFPSSMSSRPADGLVFSDNDDRPAPDPEADQMSEELDGTESPCAQPSSPQLAPAPVLVRAPAPHPQVPLRDDLTPHPPGMSTSQRAQWNPSNLGEQVRLLIEGKQEEDAVNGVMALLERLAPPSLSAELETSGRLPIEQASKGFIMDKFLADVAKPFDSSPFLDSALGSSTGGSPYVSNGDDFVLYLTQNGGGAPVDGSVKRFQLHNFKSTMAMRPIGMTPGLLESPFLRIVEPSKEMNPKNDAKHDTKPEPCDMASRYHSAQPSNLSAASSPQMDEPSEDTTSVQSASTRAHDVATLVLGERAEAVVGHLTSFFERLVESRLGVSQHQSGQAGEERGEAGGASSRSSTSLGHAPNAARGRKDNRLKGGRDDDGDSDDADDGSGNRPPAAKRPKTDETQKPKIACPYMKRHPVEFSTWRTCVGPGFGDMHMMKEHLKRKHFKENGCGRCGEHFETNRLLQDHTRAESPCTLCEIEPVLGVITQIQWDDIRRKKGTNIADVWRDIYVILFPDVDDALIPSPYFDAADTSSGLRSMIDPLEYEAYLKRHLPKRILLKLNKEFQIIAEQAKQRLVQIIQEESLETLKGFLREKGVEAPSLVDAVPLSNLDSDLNFPWDPNELDKLDPFSQQYALFPDTAPPASLSWYSESHKRRPDSAYGSNSFDKTSTEGAQGDSEFAWE